MGNKNRRSAADLNHYGFMHEGGGDHWGAGAVMHRQFEPVMGG